MADGNVFNQHHCSVTDTDATASPTANQTPGNVTTGAGNTTSGNVHEGSSDFDWWDEMIDRLVDCKNRDFVGFYGMYPIPSVPRSLLSQPTQTVHSH